ncbi:hypothetical protein CCUS01_08711 [Colletotrichum cuscutae]|uniref:Uncharacterized protein n=1 Tax=Colletotrichum cuscutae TaxID=1209917 RepID=A0AAI9XRR4_9PEZI|nr:hypothetical protein CCUS01_08711 [Colletotrichum cuscutae]
MIAMATHQCFDFSNVIICAPIRCAFWTLRLAESDPVSGEREREQSDGVSFPNSARSDTAALSDITASQSANLQECSSNHISDMACIAYLPQRLCGVESWPPRSCRTTISRPSIVVYLSRAHSASPLCPSWDRYGSLDGDSHPANKAKSSHSTASSYGS